MGLFSLSRFLDSWLTFGAGCYLLARWAFDDLVPGLDLLSLELLEAAPTNHSKQPGFVCEER